MEKETLEEAAEKHYEEQLMEFENNTDNTIFNTSRYLVAGFIEGGNYQAERMYSEEEVFNICRAFATFVMRKGPSYKKQLEWFQQFKKK